jgi:hypothetical protein
MGLTEPSLFDDDMTVLRDTLPMVDLDRLRLDGWMRVPFPGSGTARLRPGLAAIPWGWWRHQHPDGKVANSLTNDTLTEWGSGVAHSDTLVEVEAAGT